MAEFLTTHSTASQLEALIINARQDLVLISPYLKLSDLLFTRLKDADSRRVNIKIVYGKDELKKQEREKLAGLTRLRLYYLDNLHAKCYFNERQMVITSMNLYEFSEKNNREMGVLIAAREDKVLYDKAVAEAASFLKSATEMPLREKSRVGDVKNYQEFAVAPTARPVKANTQSTPGYCIRCAAPIKYDPAKPYCGKCYDKWAQFENPDYVEKTCHNCGMHEATSMNIPECKPCYNKMRKSSYHYH